MMRKTLFLAAAMVLAAAAGMASTDEYSRIARVSRLDGHVSFQHPDEVDWTAASINMALQPGDRLYTGEDGRVEIEVDDGSVFHLAEKTDLEMLSLNDDLIQVRILTGLVTLTLRSSIACEVSTPAAAFDTLRKGVYRFDVVDNGDTDAIVRKGALEAANNSFTRQIESGDLIHITPGDESINVVSRYGQRDAWDEWTDRHDADFVAYDSRKYLPDSVMMGASELDDYGRWIVVDSYGPAWVPNNVDPDWSPYCDGRWWYRPVWGWTWVSYEPWGWLPYHYGRWYHHHSFGWCWLPGVSFGFHFWSPGLVRFYTGPSWVAWCPLGPGDYYNVNNYYYSRTYSYYLNSLRLMQHRGPDELVNRSAPGAFRTVQAASFVDTSVSRLGNGAPVSTATQQPWRDGQMITDRLSLAPTSRSYAPAPERPVIRPPASRSLPSVVRNEPTVVPSGGRNSVVRVSPGMAGPGSSAGTGRGPVYSGRGGQDTGSSFGRPGASSSRSGSANQEPVVPLPQVIGKGAPAPTPPASTARPSPRTSERDRAGDAPARQVQPSRAPSAPPSSGSTVDRPKTERPSSDNPPPRNERPAERPKPQDNSRSGGSAVSRGGPAPAAQALVPPGNSGRGASQGSRSGQESNGKRH